VAGSRFHEFSLFTLFLNENVTKIIFNVYHQKISELF